jgi:hypothetical protein
MLAVLAAVVCFLGVEEEMLHCFWPYRAPASAYLFTEVKWMGLGLGVGLKSMSMFTLPRRSPLS